jgi:hypothetical protein
MKTFTGIFVLILVFASYGFPSSLGKLHGIIKDEKGSPLGGAHIALLSGAGPSKLKLVQANGKGEFTIDKLLPGEYALKASHPGYKSFIKSKIDVTAGRITALNLILQVLDLQGGDDDPKNWDVKTVLRAEADRRLIFRGAEDNNQADLPKASNRAGNIPFLRNSSVKILSNGSPFEDRAFTLSQLSTSFAFAAGNGTGSKYMLAGQLNPWNNSIWKVKNVLSHRISDNQTLNLSVGYGKSGYAPVHRGTAPELMKEARPDNFGLVQTVSFGIENEAKLFDFLTLVYGLGYDQVRSFETHAFINPELQVLITASPTMTFKGRITSKRYREADALTLPEGEIIHITDPVQFTKLGREVMATNTRHFEMSFVKNLAYHTDIETSLYADRTNGSPLFLRLTADRGLRDSLLLPLRSNQLDSEGVRFLVRRQMLDFLSASVAYVYATGTGVQEVTRPVPLSYDNLARFIKRGSFHVVATQIDADLRKTRTHVTTILKWMPHTPINTIDQFGDYKDVSNNGVNLFVRQYIPAPVFLNLGGLEALVDIRNVLDQHAGMIVTASGDTLLVKNSRSIRGGIILKF